jgi:hypothetical protein
MCKLKLPYKRLFITQLVNPTIPTNGARLVGGRGPHSPLDGFASLASLREAPDARPSKRWGF